MASPDTTPFHWPRFYEEIYGQGPLPSINGLDAVSDSYLNDPDGLSDLFPTNEYNFVIIPIKGKKATCSHMGSIIEDKLVGIYGSRRVSPLIEVDLIEAAQPMTSITVTRSKDRPIMLPTIEDFEGLNDITLASIVGTSATPISDLERWPLTMWTHPIIYTKCFSSDRDTRANSAAHLVMMIVTRTPERKEEALRLLIFLWTVKKGYAKPVKLPLPPDLPVVEERALYLDALIANAEANPRAGRDPDNDGQQGTDDDPGMTDGESGNPRRTTRRNHRASDGDLPSSNDEGRPSEDESDGPNRTQPPKKG
jgi:hypothetical protein